MRDAGAVGARRPPGVGTRVGAARFAARARRRLRRARRAGRCARSPSPARATSSWRVPAGWVGSWPTCCAAADGASRSIRAPTWARVRSSRGAPTTRRGGRCDRWSVPTAIAALQRAVAKPIRTLPPRAAWLAQLLVWRGAPAHGVGPPTWAWRCEAAPRLPPREAALVGCAARAPGGPPRGRPAPRTTGCAAPTRWTPWRGSAWRTARGSTSASCAALAARPGWVFAGSTHAAQLAYAAGRAHRACVVRRLLLRHRRQQAVRHRDRHGCGGGVTPTARCSSASPGSWTTRITVVAHPYRGSGEARHRGARAAPRGGAGAQSRGAACAARRADAAAARRPGGVRGAGPGAGAARRDHRARRTAATRRSARSSARRCSPPTPRSVRASARRTCGST